MRIYTFLVLFFLYSQLSFTQSSNYTAMQTQLCKGWNSWDYKSMLNQVLLPEGLALKVNFRQAFIGTPGDRDYFIDEFTTDTSNFIQPVAHSFDGSYSELVINNWKGNKIRVQTAASGNDIYMLVSPVLKSSIRYTVELETGIMWNRKGNLERVGDEIKATFGKAEYIIRSTNPLTISNYSYMTPFLTCEGGSPVGFYTGEKKSITELTQIIENAKNRYHEYSKKFGDMAEAFEGIETVLGWNTIYDQEKNRVISPVTRGWNEAWQGYVLFEWDTYFASYLFALDNKELAYSNAIAVTKGMNGQGFVGQWQMPGVVAEGISQPPVGSMICWKIYEKFREKWFVEEVYNELLNWNRWWIKHRVNKGYLTWGTAGWGGRQMAAWESGLDNAPMYDDVKMVSIGNDSLFSIADVGLNSMYVADCQYLAKMAKLLGKVADEKELLDRAKVYTSLTQKLWDNKAGIYLNKETETQKFSTALSPTLFYPMLAGIPSKVQANRMITEHFYNPSEFYSDYMLPSCAFNDTRFDNNYWRGAVWGPMNFLVYLGLKEYDKKAATELSDKSYQLFLNAWQKHGAVFENINSLKGVEHIKDQVNCNPFYHWGAMMGIMKFMENGKY